MTANETFLVHPTDFVKRLQAFATLALGRRPSTGQVQQTINRYVMQSHGTDQESMLALVRELFPTAEQEVA